MARDEIKSQARGFYRISLRLPVDLHAAVERMGDEEKRSLNAQIVWCVQQCVMRHAREQRRMK